MTKVWITEKPSAAKDLAAGICLAFKLTSSYDKATGQTKLSNGDVIVPLAGHVLETVKVGAYLSEAHAAIEKAYDYDRFGEFLPVCPPELMTQPRTESGKDGKKSSKPFGPYTNAARALKGAKEIVNAGDTDREGQLIVDELLEHLGIDPYGTKPKVWRFGIASNVAGDIADALKGPMESNGDKRWKLRCLAAQTRQYLDFVWGMNLSMVGQVQFKSARISAGRVQTPVLAMVQKRDDDIANFKPVRYFVPVITLADGTKMRWYRREGAEGTNGFDSEGRIVDETVARNIVARINAGLPGQVTKATCKQHSEKPPLPFSMGTLQSTASKELGLTLDEVQEAAKSLYGKHKAISYIGTDCKFLPTSLHEKAPLVLRALGKVFPKIALGADKNIVSPAFNDSKLDEHYAIVPTGELPANASPEENGVFRVISRRFIAQFYPDYVYKSHQIEGSFGADHFKATQREDLRLGWKEVEGQSEAGPTGAPVEGERDKDQPDDDVVEVMG